MLETDPRVDEGRVARLLGEIGDERAIPALLARVTTAYNPSCLVASLAKLESIQTVPLLAWTANSGLHEHQLSPELLGSAPA